MFDRQFFITNLNHDQYHDNIIYWPSFLVTFINGGSTQLEFQYYIDLDIF